MISYVCVNKKNMSLVESSCDNKITQINDIFYELSKHH